MNLLISLRSEVLKTKRTASFYLTILAAMFGPVMSMLDIVLSGISDENGKVFLNKMFTEKFQMTGLVMLPMFIILICTLLPQIEYKNNAWKQVLASPQTRGNIYFAKFANIQLLILLFIIVNQLTMFLGAIVLHFTNHALNLLNQSTNSREIMSTILNSYVALLAMSSIQFWLGLRFRNFIVPIAIGILCWFVGTILVMQFKEATIVYFPYCFHVYSILPQFKPRVNTINLVSVGYTIVFLAFGFWDFTRREKK